MPWSSLKIAPGFVRNATRYAASGTWFDGSLVRFRDGFPERWAGWVNLFSSTAFTMHGICRSLFRHGTLSGLRWISAGTTRKFYMALDDVQYDVSPYAETGSVGADSYPVPITLPANPLSTTIGTKIVKVHHVAHAHFVGDSVEIAGAAAIGGVPAGDINKEQEITGWVDEDNYQITVATTATSTVSGGGGAAVTVRYIYSPGTDDVLSGGGWGISAWGEDFWGMIPTTAGADQLGVWTHENWGEDLVANPNGGPIFYWNATDPDHRMVNILDIQANYLGTGSPAADGNAPSEAQFIIVSHRDRHLLAFGGSIYGGAGAVEPMTFRWCSQETITNWNEADLTGTAGSLPLSNGSKFLSGIATQREILAWSDQALYSIQYVGSPFIYVADIIDKWSDICGLKARCSFGGVVYWMGNGGFYAYSGRTDVLPCAVWDYISQNLNRDQMAKVYAGSNQRYNEVLFFYPSVASTEVDSYVAFDVVQKIWTYGVLGRSAWMDIDAISPVVAAEPVTTGGRLFEHDNGSDDGSTTPPQPIIAYIESGPIELSSDSYQKGDRMMFVRRLIPDVTFRDIETSTTAPSMRIVLKMMDFPGTGFGENSSNSVARTATVPIEMFDDEATGDGQGYVRLRGRSLTLRAESDTLGSEWRLGIQRIDARTDGQR